MSKKGLLIYPPNQLMDIETPRPDGSLGPLYLASALEKNNIGADILDASVGAACHRLEDTFYRNIKQSNGLTRIGLSFEEIANYVDSNNYDFIGISSNFTPQTNMALETARAIKAINPTIPIFTGGVNSRALSKTFMQSGFFEGICISEGEIIFPNMINNFFKYGNLSRVAGCIYSEGEKIITNKVNESCFPAHLDDLAMPAWDKLPFEKYERISSPHGISVIDRGNVRYAPIMTSRGCPFRCSYCHVSNETRESDLTGQIGNLRLHSVQRVIDEIDYLISLHVTKLFIEDDSLLADKARVKTIFRTIADRNLSISNVNGVNLVHFYNRSSDKWTIDIEYLEILKNAGFEQIVFPVESGSKRILKKYATNKVNLDKMDLPFLMKTMTRIGISAPVNMMIGFPDETEEEISESIDLAKKLIQNGAPYVTFFIPIPFPGSSLYNIAIAGGYLDENFNPDMMNWKRPVMRNTTVPPERLEYIRDAANNNINTELHLKKRLKDSMGARWQSTTG
jgi:radical SAM superfamily enzyme YgiQ (UPF0313 family)